jgi:hypothetical protein
MLQVMPSADQAEMRERDEDADEEEPDAEIERARVPG